jgi:hypothetical protein
MGRKILLAITILLLFVLLCSCGCSVKSSRSVKFEGGHEDSQGNTYYTITNTGTGAVSHIKMRVQWLDATNKFCSETNIDTQLNPPLESHQSRDIIGPSISGCKLKAIVGYEDLYAQYTDNGYYNLIISADHTTTESASL